MSVQIKEKQLSRSSSPILTSILQSCCFQVTTWRIRKLGSRSKRGLGRGRTSFWNSASLSENSDAREFWPCIEKRIISSTLQISLECFTRNLMNLGTGGLSL